MPGVTRTHSHARAPPQLVDGRARATDHEPDASQAEDDPTFPQDVSSRLIDSPASSQPSLPKKAADDATPPLSPVHYPADGGTSEAAGTTGPMVKVIDGTEWVLDEKNAKLDSSSNRGAFEALTEAMDREAELLRAEAGVEAKTSNVAAARKALVEATAETSAQIDTMGQIAAIGADDEGGLPPAVAIA